MSTASGSLLGDLGAVAETEFTTIFDGEGVTRSTAVAVSPSDTVYVGESSQLIRWTAARGVDTLGRDGSGPGELRHLAGVVDGPDGVWVADANLLRLTHYPVGEGLPFSNPFLR